MNTIVLNTLTGSVSEYDWTFQSITPTHAGDASGLYLLGGDLDNAGSDTPLPINASIVTGKTLCGDSLKKAVLMIYLSLRGVGNALVTVFGETDSWTYSLPLRSSGESRVQPGKGIRENYLAFGFSNVDGADFTLDRIEADIVASKTRRV
jgi:hypothetical protein